MLSFETRVRALRAAYFAVVVGAAGYLFAEQATAPALVVGVAGLLKARRWLAPWLAAQRALAATWRPVTVGPLTVEVPPGWTAAPANEGRGVQLDGPGAFVLVILWPHRQTSDAAAVEGLLAGVASKVRLRGVRPCVGTIGGFPATGRRADVATLSDSAVVEVLAARTLAGSLLTLASFRDVGLPASLLQRCADRVTLSGEGTTA